MLDVALPWIFAGIFLAIFWRFLIFVILIIGFIVALKNNAFGVPRETVNAPIVSTYNGDIQQTSFDVTWLLRNWFSYKATESIDKSINGPKNETPAVVEREVLQPVTETPQMLEYIKNCTELTSNSKLCRENWIDVASHGEEIILLPVEYTPYSKSDKGYVQKISTKKPKEPQIVAKSNITQFKLLDVDNEEYKARRAEALAKPNAIVIHETLR